MGPASVGDGGKLSVVCVYIKVFRTRGSGQMYHTECLDR